MPENSNKILNDKFLGAFLGAGIGDALGWPNERNSKNLVQYSKSTNELFRKWVRNTGGRFWSHEEVVYPGEYSDDTQLLIATARSLTYGDNWHKFFIKVELPMWLSYERGGGSATKRAANVWKNGKTPWKNYGEKVNDSTGYFEAGGNGVAMRILPHVIYCNNDVNELMRQVVRNGIYTHGHPRALIGATVYAYALYLACNHKGTLGYGELVDRVILDRNIWGKFPDIHNINEWIESANLTLRRNYLDLWDDTVKLTIDSLEIIREGLSLGALDIGNDILTKIGCFDKKISGAGDVTAISAIYVASKYASNPKMGVLESAFMLGADTDTLSSMVGGILGMIHGTDWIPLAWQSMQDRDYIVKIATKITNHVVSDYNVQSSNADLKDMLKRAVKGDTINTLPFGEMKVVDTWNNKTKLENISITTIKVQSMDGQTIFVKRMEKITPKLHNTINNQDNKQLSFKYEDDEISQTSIKHKRLLEFRLNSDNLRQMVDIIDSTLSAKKLLLLFQELLISKEKDFNDISIKYDITESQLKKLLAIIRGY